MLSHRYGNGGLCVTNDDVTNGAAWNEVVSSLIGLGVPDIIGKLKQQKEDEKMKAAAAAAFQKIQQQQQKKAAAATAAASATAASQPDEGGQTLSWESEEEVDSGS